MPCIVSFLLSTAIAGFVCPRQRPWNFSGLSQRAGKCTIRTPGCRLLQSAQKEPDCVAQLWVGGVQRLLLYMAFVKIDGLHDARPLYVMRRHAAFIHWTKLMDSHVECHDIYVAPDCYRRNRNAFMGLRIEGRILLGWWLAVCFFRGPMAFRVSMASEGWPPFLGGDSATTVEETEAAAPRINREKIELYPYDRSVHAQRCCYILRLNATTIQISSRIVSLPCHTLKPMLCVIEWRLLCKQCWVIDCHMVECRSISSS